MKTFSFRLEKVLEWRQTRFEQERTTLLRLIAESADLNRQLQELRQSRYVAQQRTSTFGATNGAELAVLSTFLGVIDKRQKKLIQLKNEQRLRVAAQQRRVIEERRRVELLEKLKQRCLKLWVAELNHELESFAAEMKLLRSLWQKTIQEVNAASTSIQNTVLERRR